MYIGLLAYSSIMRRYKIPYPSHNEMKKHFVTFLFFCFAFEMNRLKSSLTRQRYKKKSYILILSIWRYESTFLII